MKTKRQKHTLVCVFTVLSIAIFDIASLSAQTVASKASDFKYELSQDMESVVVTGLKSTDNKSVTKIIIPDTIEDMPVKEIGEEAFKDCKALVSVELPSFANGIGKYAFEGCKALASIKLPDSIAYIGWGSFLICASLTSIELPDSITEIEGYTFYGCTALESFKLPRSIEKIKCNAFEGCSSLKNITVPEGVNKVDFRDKSWSSGYNDAFKNCSALPLKEQAKLRKIGYKDSF